MFVLHAHWCPARRSVEQGEMLFWAESTGAEEPVWSHGRLPKKPTAKPHPFCMPAEELRDRIGLGTPLGSARSSQAKMQLPSSRTGPIPSPELLHNWDLDIETEPFLAPWLLEGLFLPSSKAFGVLLNLPKKGESFVLGQDVLYWRKVAGLILEVLAAQRVVPVLIQLKGRDAYIARWHPVLDGAGDGPRMTQLAAAMPPLCRMDALHPNGRYRMNGRRTPQMILSNYLKMMTDAIMRSWGRSVAPVVPVGDNPAQAWIAALFKDDPTVEASSAQLQALGSSLRAWMRNLQAAGDSNSRVAFKLETPAVNGGLDTNGSWKLRFFLQARDDLSTLVPSEEIWLESTDTLNYQGKRFERPQERLLTGLGYAASLYSPLLPELKNSHPTDVQLDTSQAYSFLRFTGPLLEQAGFGLVPPEWWNTSSARLGVRLRLRPKNGDRNINQITPAANYSMSLDRLLEYQWELSIGDQNITQDEFETLAAMKSPLVQVRGRWVQLDDEQIEAAHKFFDSGDRSGAMSLLDAVRYGLGGADQSQPLPVTDVVAEDWVSEWLDRLSFHDRLQVLQQPEGMNGVLREYQLRGYSWLSFFRRWGMGCCLADDMGLGKTIQALALLQNEKNEQRLFGPVLLICPTSVVINWQREAKRFTPGLRTLIHQGPNRFRGEEFLEQIKQYDMILTSYAVIRMDIDLLSKADWQGVILDEAQNIKNPSAKQSKATRELTSGFRMALTGTPVENRLSELWSIMQFLNPGLLSTRQAFRRHFALPIERFGDREATARLRSLISPFILRRSKSDPNVIQDLPEKIEVKEYCDLSEEQAHLYEQVVKATMEEIAASEGFERKGLVLRLLLHLKQVCNHPAHFLHEADRNGRELVFFGRSGKVRRLMGLLEEILDVGDRVLIFTQFVEMGKLLSSYLPAELGTRLLFLHGGTSPQQRDHFVRAFQEDPNSPPIFLLSLKAGGTGLNLTEANHVIHFDRWWNPAVEDQATDRAFRIGQHRNVQVRKFITQGTLEERIDDMIEAKKGLVEAIIESDEQWLTELSTEELRELVRLRL